MKPRDIRRRDGGDLEQEVKRLRDEIFHRRLHSANEEKADRGLVRKHRRDIARIKTEQRRRELEKIKAVSDDVLTRSIAEQEKKSTGPGKRRAKRAVRRLSAIRSSRLQKTAPAPAAAKGK